MEQVKALKSYQRLYAAACGGHPLRSRCHAGNARVRSRTAPPCLCRPPAVLQAPGRACAVFPLAQHLLELGPLLLPPRPAARAALSWLRMLQCWTPCNAITELQNCR